MTIHFSNNSGTGKWPLKGDKPLTWTRDPIIEPWLWEEEYISILVGGFNPFEKYACQIRTLPFPNFRGENKNYLSCHHLVLDFNLNVPFNTWKT